MRAQDIVIGESYRHKTTPDYGWAKVVTVLRPKEGDNTTTRIVVKCEWSIDKNGTFGLIKYFNPADLVSNTTHKARKEQV